MGLGELDFVDNERLKAIFGSSETKRCQRSACGRPISSRGFVRIWNNKGHFPEYRDYCPHCGLSILQHNPGIQYEKHLNGNRPTETRPSL